MKNTIKIIAALLLVAWPVLGQSVKGHWNVKGQGSGLGLGQGNATNGYAVAPAGPGAPRVQFISAATDKVNAQFKFYTNSAPTIVSSNLASGSTNWVYASTNTGGIGAVTNGDLLIFRHAVSNTTYEVFAVHTATASVVTITGGTGFSNNLSIGDIVYKVGNWGTNAGITGLLWTWPPVLNSNTMILTNSITSQAGFYTGKAGEPLLMQIDSTASNTIHQVSGDYVTY